MNKEILEKVEQVQSIETIKERFERIKREPRDINEHLDTLYMYASRGDVNVIVELGVNEGISTTAFCIAIKECPNKTFYNYDIHIEPTFQKLLDMCKEEEVKINFTMEDDLLIEIPECDLLFIDTNHVGEHLRKELKLHGNKSRKYLIFHDTETFGNVGSCPGTEGLIQPILDFIKENKHWELKYHYKNNNGLTILQRS